MISLEMMIHEGRLAKEDLGTPPVFPPGRVDYPAASSYKMPLLRAAHARFRGQEGREDFQRFLRDSEDWLPDYALFMALKERFQGRPWNEWPADLRDRSPDLLRAAREELRERVAFEQFVQYLFHGQWMSLREHCRQAGVGIFGDLPIYVTHDSSDVWTHPDLFHLDARKIPVSVAGVPPDYFSRTGQLWGNPVYRWDRLKETGYAWWFRRLERNFQLFDLVRIDHFRGFAAYWEVPAAEKTAINGAWVPGPGDDFFRALQGRFSPLPIVAEDLGLITDDVRELMDRFDLPGMKILLFAFGDDLASNPYAPHNHVRNCLVYTGTHDNNTARGWYRSEMRPEDRQRVERYLGRKVGPEEFSREMVRLALMSVARTAILPMQDVLGLGAEARMNTPAVANGNWEWQLVPDQLGPAVAADLREMTEMYGRI
jgi:4-alpha-glucanotransferase